VNNSISKACQITSRVLKILKQELKPGVTEVSLARLAKKLLIQYGADSIAFPPIIAFGSNAATPHHTPTQTKLKKNDIALIDIGCKIKDLCSDMSRTYCLGNPPKNFTTVQKTVLAAHQKALDTIAPNIKAKKIDAAARKIITKAGFGPYFIHSTGHGIGKNVHQYPTIGPKSTGIIKPNTHITIEPGIYLPNHFGYRHEDTVLVTKSGYKILTTDN